MESAMLGRLVVLAMALFAIGLLGVLWRRNLLVALLSLQLMMGAGQLALVAFAAGWSMGDTSSLVAGVDARSFAVIAMLVGVVQIAVGLAIALSVVRMRDSIDVEDATAMRW